MTRVLEFFAPHTHISIAESYGVFVVITISPRQIARNWGTISFASTLYLCPILDILLADVPCRWRAELRLGLQEALVNAAKHGNKLDPSKVVIVSFSVADDHYWWVISDQDAVSGIIASAIHGMLLRARRILAV